MIDELLKFNGSFVESKGYEKYITNKYPDKKIAIVTCMDRPAPRRTGNQERRREDDKERRRNHQPPVRKCHAKPDGGHL